MSHRRITVQLTALLDLMLILVFMQYLEIDEHVAEQQRSTEQRVAAVQEELRSARNDHDMLAASLTMRSSELTEAREALTQVERDLERVREERDTLVSTLPDVFSQPEEKIKKFMSTTSPDGTRPTKEQIEQLRAEFKKLAAQQPDAALRHLTTFNEMKKRCDLWHLHVLENGVIVLATDKTQVKFRAESAAAFEESLFQRYKSLADPKSLVIVLYSFGDIDFGTYKAVKDGLPLATRHMEQDSLGRTRFTFREIGFFAEPPFEVR